MIGKIHNNPFQKISQTVHGEMEQNKRHSQDERTKQDGNSKQENNKESNGPSSDISLENLNTWVTELNCLECYVKNDLKFTIDSESNHTSVSLQDIKGHTLQEYLPVQFKALYTHLKEDKDDSKGTILNLSC
ncbi:MAG: hypothetical protein H7281_15385 [Bacteriovorax sp.]|nr:hypothetical protein [Bacteriovorax sp.]